MAGAVPGFLNVFLFGRGAGSKHLHASSILPYGLSVGGRSGLLFGAAAKGIRHGK
jgi:hypothetical protein